VCKFDVLDFARVIGDAFAPKLHDAIRDREQRIVGSDSHVQTRPDCRAALTDDDVAGFCGFTFVEFYAEPLPLRIAYVTG